MLSVMNIWASDLWALMESDFAFALIGGGIILATQLVTAAIGVWKNVGLEGDKFDWRRFVESLLKEVGLTVILLAAVALTYMVANLASLSILPGFDVGDVPTAALLLAYGARVLDHSKSIWDNLMVILNGESDEF